MHPIPRREALKEIAVAGAVAVIGLPDAVSAEDATNPIRTENARPGTRDWMLSKARIDVASKYRCPWIEGYCSHASAQAGEEIQFFISTNPAAKFALDIFRLGYYGGDGGRLVQRFEDLAGETQPDPAIGAKRLRDCEWKASVEWTVPEDAVRLRRHLHLQSRHASRPGRAAAGEGLA